MTRPVQQLDLTHLEHVVRIADLGSLSAAARQLGISQPSMSEMLGRIEKEIGIELFTRKRRGVELTPAGLKLVEYARDILRYSDTTFREVRRAGKQAKKTLTVGLTPGLALRFSVSLSERIMRDFPQISLRIKEAGSSLLQNWLLDGSLDLAVTYQHQKHSEIGTERLFREKLFLIASPQSWPPEEKAASNVYEPVSCSDLKTIPLILTTRPNSLREIIEYMLRTSNIKFTPFQESDSLPHITSLLLLGKAFTILPRFAVSDPVESGKLLLIPFTHPQAHVDVYVTYHKLAMGSSEIAPLVNLLHSIGGVASDLT